MGVVEGVPGYPSEGQVYSHDSALFEGTGVDVQRRGEDYTEHA